MSSSRLPSTLRSLSFSFLYMSQTRWCLSPVRKTAKTSSIWSIRKKYIKDSLIFSRITPTYLRMSAYFLYFRIMSLSREIYREVTLWGHKAHLGNAGTLQRVSCTRHGRPPGCSKISTALFLNIDDLTHHNPHFYTVWRTRVSARTASIGSFGLCAGQVRLCALFTPSHK